MNTIQVLVHSQCEITYVFIARVKEEKGFPNIFLKTFPCKNRKSRLFWLLDNN